MALKKVKRPILVGPSEDGDKQMKKEQTEIDVNKYGKEEKSMNQINKVNNYNLNKSYSEVPLSSNAQKNPAMERVISFKSDSISIQRIAKIPEGTYEYQIEEINVRENVETQYGLKDQYVITFALYSEVTEQVTRVSIPYNISSNQQSALMTFLNAFKETFRGQMITIGSLVELTGQARIHHMVSENGNVFEKIEILTVE
ncbi:hypothetical protein CJ194_23680 [Priestia megaterium]|uniref:hypothetical protein n=1 Tax=Priestia megaterium TaxID=1404 RepID=UPI000C807745|nr:hypothetical protein [Priestia megaterium]PMD07605.1 hypothetical protein CJ194_23680 [Priestia megaterium]